MKKRISSVTKHYLLMRKLYLNKIPLLPNCIKRYMRIVFSCEIPFTCEISENVVFAHNGLGVVINASAKIGDNTIIYQNVTIGNRNKNGSPKIGKNVLIGAGACILGDVIIGDNAKIGANAVVLHDVPENAVAVGVPAKIVY